MLSTEPSFFVSEAAVVEGVVVALAAPVNRFVGVSFLSEYLLVAVLAVASFLASVAAGALEAAVLYRLPAAELSPASLPLSAYLLVAVLSVSLMAKRLGGGGGSFFSRAGEAVGVLPVVVEPVRV